AHGPSVHTRRWARAFRDRGHEVRLLTAFPTPAPEAAERVIGLNLPFHALRYLSAVGAVRETARTFLPDVTVAHFLPNYGLLAALSGVRAWMVACWGSDLLVNARRSPFHLARAGWVLRRAPLVHVDAAVLAEAAVSLGARPERVWTRAWGVDVSVPPAARARDGAIRVLWTRQLEPVYDPQPFLRALGILKRRGIPFRASMAGDGPMRGLVEGWIREEDLAREVTLEGFVGEERLRALHRASDLYVSASRSDSTSQSLLEAMAAGLLPIVTDIAGNREWVTHRTHGYLVPVGDKDALACAIAEAIQDPETAAMRARARERVVESASFEETVTLLEAKLNTLARAGGAS
ncbi:MAG TPA: glycosyltransferase family 4 protein, partial [Candidatus Saccharimonadales bacterium]|nr:glycosyltransferase family 4 protein [Candidatus Saccharimonadales bacterium]